MIPSLNNLVTAVTALMFTRKINNLRHPYYTISPQNKQSNKKEGEIY